MDAVKQDSISYPEDNQQSKRSLRILRGATIITMDPQRRIVQNGALVIESGRIAWLGEDNELPIHFKEHPFDWLSERYIFPGFVNLHTHAALVVLRGVGDDRGIAPAYSPRVPQGVFLSPEDVYSLALLGGLEAIQFGATCIVDNYIYEHQAAKAFELLGLRAVVSERLHDADLFRVPNGLYQFDSSQGEKLVERALELIETWNGATQGRIHAWLGPHAPDTCSKAYLQRIALLADELGIGMVIHLAQSQQEVAQIRTSYNKTPVAYLDELEILGPRTIAGHCIYLTEMDKELLASSGTQICHLSGSNAKGGMMAPIRDLIERGANVGLGTDNMAGDMIEAMRLAVCTARMRAEHPQAMRAIQALEMATLGGARALGMQDEIGSLEIGKRADLIVVDFRKAHLSPVIDPIANLIYNGLASDVEQVFVDGEQLVKDGRSTRVELEEVLLEVQGRTEALWDKMKPLSLDGKINDD